MSGSPHGVGREVQEIADLELAIATILEKHRKNAIIDLEPDAFNEAMKRQAQIDALKARQREKAREYGVRGLRTAHAQASQRMETRIETFRRKLEAEGGIGGAPWRRIAREMRISPSTATKYLHILRERAAAGPPTCPVCKQHLPVNSIPTINDEDTQS